jgi:hypothetical protein
MGSYTSGVPDDLIAIVNKESIGRYAIAIPRTSKLKAVLRVILYRLTARFFNIGVTSFAVKYLLVEILTREIGEKYEVRLLGRVYGP